VSLLPYDWIACAALALCLGCCGPRAWKARLILGAAIGLLGWAASFPLMMVGTGYGYDVSLAEDYLDGADVTNSLIAIALAITWSLLWLAFGALASLLWRKIVGTGR